MRFRVPGAAYCPHRARPSGPQPHRLLHAISAGLLWLALAFSPAWAGRPVDALAPPEGALGRAADTLVEDRIPHSFDEARARFAQGDGVPGTRAVFAAGIGAAPVWLRWTLDNATARPLPRRLSVATPWIDQLDLYLVSPDGTVQHWHTGDALPQGQRPVAGIDFAFDLTLPPGRSTLFLRAEADDPMVLPVQLATPEAAASAAMRDQYLHGLVYGYLLALLAYNLLLYLGLKQRSHLLYALYLAAFGAMNLAYTGHGYLWLWPDSPGVQRFVILILMVLFSVAGLLFAARFLELDGRAPRLRRRLNRLCLASLALIGVAAAAGAQQAAAWLAFSTVLAMAPAMLALGLAALRWGHPAARVFLAAATAGAAGTVVTTLTVWGLLPFTEITYRAVEIGMLVDATLLALALAQRFRAAEQERLRAEHLARTDALTRLPNRRALQEQGDSAWHAARRSGRPLSALMIDLDHFKQINDRHGHARGDAVLEAVGRLLLADARRGDLVARWGGEEFAVLMPDTDATQARVLAERLRVRLAALRIDAPHGTIQLSGSFGLATTHGEVSLDALFEAADARLLRAKAAGRDRVVDDDPPGPTAATP